MHNIILGGGIIAMLARDILGDSWTIIPMGRSRFYSFIPSLADNFIISDSTTSDYINQFAALPIIRKIGYSFNGEILFNNRLILNDLLNKLYHDHIPPHVHAYWSGRDIITTIGKCTDIYRELQNRYKNELLNNTNKYGYVDKIINHTIYTTEGIAIEYDRIINTIPQNAMLGICKHDIKLPALDTWYYHLRTEDLDLDNSDITYVIDPHIEFYKVTRLDAINYLFQSHKQIEQPGNYFIPFINKFDLIGETMIEESVPCGPIPNISLFEDLDIVNIGSLATWDDCLDTGSCIKRLINLN